MSCQPGIFELYTFWVSSILGSKEFVFEVFDQIKHLLWSKDERTFKPVGGIEGGIFLEKVGMNRQRTA